MKHSTNELIYFSGDDDKNPSGITAEQKDISEMRKQGDYWDLELQNHPEWQPPVADPENPGKLIIPEDNRAALWLYRDWNQENNQGTMEEWASTLFPTALALYGLQRVKDGGRVLNSGFMDGRTEYLFSTMLDAIGIRNRADIYSNNLVNLARDTGDDTLDVVSLGCGAGVPNIDASIKVKETLNKSIRWDFYDLDTRSLGLSKELVEEAGLSFDNFNFGGGTGLGRVSKRSFTEAFRRLPESSVHAVDALGLWEYLSPETARNFAEKAYKLVKPGGSLIISNMLSDRPQREFNQRAVGWPGLFLRSEDDLLTIIDSAGIPLDDIRMTRTEDQVYVVMEIKKP